MTPGSAGFPPAKRLRRSHDYSRVFANPARSSDRYFTVLARQNELGAARLGLAISRKAASRAVDRNKLKRIARETFRKQSLPPLDFVILARADAAAAARPALRASLAAHFAKLSKGAPPSRTDVARRTDDLDG
ncbi:MAG TPA: ribonuclease P protein component [Gammaproteobacteria bacterium]|nr:ribonuclease P protein component [Gammaproteobacteria bacterium]